MLYTYSTIVSFVARVTRARELVHHINAGTMYTGTGDALIVICNKKGVKFIEYVDSFYYIFTALFNIVNLLYFPLCNSNIYSKKAINSCGLRQLTLI